MAPEVAFGSQYLLGQAIGRGAMGRVFRGVLRGSGEPVAIKILRDDLAGQSDVVARFVQERQALRSIRHENVVSVRDLVVEGDQLGIVMDLVEGGDLRGLMRMSPVGSTAAELLAQMARGLGAVHASGVVHRDLKPENVLVHRNPDGTVRLQLTDFGVARLVGQSMTKVTSMIGTPGYLAPEASHGERTAGPADVYALGVIFYEMLCGEPPFVGDNVLAVVRAHAEDPVPRPVGLPEDAWQLVAEMLDKFPSNRPSAVAVAERAAVLGPTLAEAGSFVVDRTAHSRPRAADAITEPVGSPSEAGTRIVQRPTGSPLPPPVPASPERRQHRKGRIVAICIGATAVLAGSAIAVVRPWAKEAVASEPLEYSFTPAVYDGGVVVTRKWVMTTEGQAVLSSELTLSNTTNEPSSASHYEVIPKSVASDVGTIDFAPEPTEVVQRDPVVRYDLSMVPPGGSITVTYSVNLGAEFDDPAEKLKRFVNDQQAATEDFAAEQGFEEAVTLERLEVTPSDAVILPMQTVALQATGQMTDGSAADPAALGAIAWTSSEPTVASVDGNGLVTGLAGGSTTVTAQVGDFTVEVSIVVTPPATTPVTTTVLPTTIPELTAPPATRPPPTTARPTTTVVKPTTTTTKPTTTTTAPTPPSAPNISGSVSGLGISWSWSVTSFGSHPLARYDVYFNGSLVQSNTSTSYTSTGLAYSSTYSLRVVVFNSANRSSEATAVRTTGPAPTTAAPPPPQPSLGSSKGNVYQGGLSYVVVSGSNWPAGVALSYQCEGDPRWFTTAPRLGSLGTNGAGSFVFETWCWHGSGISQVVSVRGGNVQLSTTSYW